MGCFRMLLGLGLWGGRAFTLLFVQFSSERSHAFDGLPFFGRAKVAHQMLNPFSFIRMNVQWRWRTFGQGSACHILRCGGSIRPFVGWCSRKSSGKQLRGWRLDWRALWERGRYSGLAWHNCRALLGRGGTSTSGSSRQQSVHAILVLSGCHLDGFSCHLVRWWVVQESRLDRFAISN